MWRNSQQQFQQNASFLPQAQEQKSTDSGSRMVNTEEAMSGNDTAAATNQAQLGIQPHSSGTLRPSMAPRHSHPSMAMAMPSHPQSSPTNLERQQMMYYHQQMTHYSQQWPSMTPQQRVMFQQQYQQYRHYLATNQQQFRQAAAQQQRMSAATNPAMNPYSSSTMWNHMPNLNPYPNTTSSLGGLPSLHTSGRSAATSGPVSGRNSGRNSGRGSKRVSAPVSHSGSSSVQNGTKSSAISIADSETGSPTNFVESVNSGINPQLVALANGDYDDKRYLIAPPPDFDTDFDSWLQYSKRMWHSQRQLRNKIKSQPNIVNEAKRQLTNITERRQKQMELVKQKQASALVSTPTNVSRLPPSTTAAAAATVAHHSATNNITKGLMSLVTEPASPTRHPTPGIARSAFYLDATDESPHKPTVNETKPKSKTQKQKKSKKTKHENMLSKLKSGATAVAASSSSSSTNGNKKRSLQSMHATDYSTLVAASAIAAAQTLPQSSVLQQQSQSQLQSQRQSQPQQSSIKSKSSKHNLDMTMGRRSKTRRVAGQISKLGVTVMMRLGLAPPKTELKTYPKWTKYATIV